MKVFVAGATGVLGRRLVPLLVDAGHDVTGMTRTPGKTELLRRLGATPAIKRPMVGRTAVAHALTKWAAVMLRKGVTVRPGVFNGQPGAMAFDAAGRVVAVMVVEVVDGRIAAVRSVLNPEKLGHLARA